VRIMKFLPYGSPIPLVFLRVKFHLKNSKVFTERGRQTRVMWQKLAIF